MMATVLEKERRECGRGTFKYRKQGELYLHVDGQPVGIRKVIDHTPGGMGLLIDGHFTKGSEVSLRYQHLGSTLKFPG